MMNFDLAARALAVGCQATMAYGVLSIATAGSVAIGGFVVDSLISIPSTLINCAKVVMNSSEAKAEASLRRIRAVALFALKLVVCCGGVIGTIAAVSEPHPVIVPSTFVPKYAFNSIVDASVVGFAAYTSAEFVVLVASAIITAAATLTMSVVKAVPSAVTTFGDRIDAVMFEFVSVPSSVYKMAFNAVVPKKPRAPIMVYVAPEETAPVVAKTTTTCAAAVETKKSNKKTVSFGTVQVQEYRVTLGDHPLCKRYPMTLDWFHTEATEVAVDAFEQVKSTKAGGRPSMQPHDRKARIAQVTGVCPTVVQQKEHRRRRKLEIATKAIATSKPKKGVSFGKVEIREYSLTLGDHPCCDSYPLSLDWSHTNGKTFELDRFEEAKSSIPRPDPTPKQRLARIAQVTGLETVVIEKKERRRVRKLEAAKSAVVVDEQQQQPAILPMVSAVRTGKSLGGYHEV